MKDIIIITDIGSTTTKALYLKKELERYLFMGYETAFTTVEKPNEDVKIGIYKAVRKLEEKHNLKLLQQNSEITQSDFQFAENVSYLTTSSAGGGLQILVIGLTKSESASSAQRAAFGVGGVLLDTLSIDDNKSTIEKMQILNTVHPDIILFCGGVDGGALFSVYRLAEILKLANPKQKFNVASATSRTEFGTTEGTEANSGTTRGGQSNIPLVFAGNVDAVDFIDIVFSKKFNLHIVPNLRPTMREENLEPTKEKIHELFMNSVMEQAPGYSQVKNLVETDIIPTPSGVLKTLKLLGNTYKSSIAFDIGGATTDVYSNLIGNYHRTVSANFGMSYSIGNILAESQIKPPKSQSEIGTTKGTEASSDTTWGGLDYEYFLNYIGNKIIYPDFQPTQDIDKFIEHLVAIEGIKMSLKQHFNMHFMTKRVGFLDNLKMMASRDKWKETMYYPHYDKNLLFSMSNIEVAIGAGGIMSHATKEQAIFVLIESMGLEGFTELWRDKYFISPHLGVLSDIDEKIAEQLILNECFEKLAIYVRPIITNFKTKDNILNVMIENQEYHQKANDVLIINTEKESNITLIPSKHCLVDKTDFMLPDGLPLIIDTRNRDDENSVNILLDKLRPYKKSQITNHKSQIPPPTPPAPQATLGGQNEIPPLTPPINVGGELISHILRFSLPYKGTIHVKEGEKVSPDTLLGENVYDPPLIYVVLISRMIGKQLFEEEIRQGLLINIDDKIAIGDKIFKYHAPNTLFGINEIAYSPVRGIVEQINFATGTIILREIQDYPTKPVVLNIAKSLKVKEKHLKGFMKKREGEFVYAGEILASNQAAKYITFESPYTGTIQKIDSVNGTVTICYDKKPYQLYSQCFGVVERVTEENEVFISVNAVKIEGKIGFGKDVGGEFGIRSLEFGNENTIEKSPPSPPHSEIASGGVSSGRPRNDELGGTEDGIITFVHHISSIDELRSLADKNIKGLICNTMPYSCLKSFLGKDIGVAITGNEDIPFPLIILKGFANEAVVEESDFFGSCNGKYVLMKPYTQIRAGVTRPQIYFFESGKN